MNAQPIYYCDALRFAKEFEEKGEKFYRDSIQKVNDEFAKKTLNFLADEELHHIEKINKLNAALTADSEDFNLDTHCQTKLPERIENHLKESIKREKQKIQPQSRDVEIYDMALELEKAGYAIYKEYHQQSDDERTKIFFEFLIKEESLHYDLLASSKKYFEDSSYYFEDYGGWIFGGV